MTTDGRSPRDGRDEHARSHGARGNATTDERGDETKDGGLDRPGPGAPTAVEFDGVTKRYGETAAVDGVDLAIREGEFFTVVGPSGCGKTTTLRLVAGFESPTEGRVRFGGTDVSGVPPEDRDVGVVFQNYALFPHLSVGENVGYGLRFSSPPGGVSREERITELLELVDLPGVGDRDPESLSGGQQQRVAIARALAPGPDVLLLDEPMSALDALLRERLRLQVRSIQRSLGITTVYVTHDQAEALSVSDRVAVMRDGAVVQVAPPRTVYRRPASRFVAEFVGDNNVLEGVVAAEGDAQTVAYGDSSSDETGDDETDDEGTGDGPARVVPVDVAGTRFRVARSEAPETDTLDEAPETRTPGDAAVEDPTTDASGRSATPRPGDRVVFCVRPQHLRVGRAQNGFRADVEGTEFLGEMTRVHLTWNDRPLVLSVDGPLAGSVTVGFDPRDAHIVEHAAPDGTADTS